jgi:hypothetical protein
VWGRTKEHNAGYSEGEHASTAGQHYTSEQEGTQKAPHGGQQADHSPPAESGGIQMHVWGKAKEHNAG